MYAAYRYGEYRELCGILHRYIKPADTILVIGCGNSTVSSNLYDLGYKLVCLGSVSFYADAYLTIRRVYVFNCIFFLSRDRKITNIDVSGVVVKRMQQKYAKSRPGLIYLRMDALQTEFATASFTTIFDKGTLDALFPDNSDESKNRISRLFNVSIPTRSTYTPTPRTCIDVILGGTLWSDKRYSFTKPWCRPTGNYAMGQGSEETSTRLAYFW